MAIVKRFNELLDLDEIDVLIDETDKSRHIIVSDLPDSLPQGKSSFLIELSPFLKDGVEIQMDFIDNDGASIYLEPVSEYLEGTARRVSAEVYGDTAPGIATLIIVGELESIPEDATIFSDVDPVPVEYQGAYNIRLTKQVVINPTAVNTQIIKFFDQPKINVSEIRKGTMVRSEVTGSKFTSEFNVEGTPTDSDLLFKPHGAIDNDIKQGSGGTASPKKQRNIKAYIESRKRKNKKGLRKNSAFKRSGLLSKTNSPATFPYQLKIGDFDGVESFRFNTAHIGGSVTFFESDLGNTFTNSNFYPSSTLSDSGIIDTPTFDTLKEQEIVNVSASMYTASIVDLINDKTAVVELPFTNKNNNGENIILPIFAKAKIAYENMPTGSYAAANLVSYADVKLSNMRTFSGDVYKVKVYVKSEGGFDDYKLLSEVPLESKELLVDTESIGQAERTGYVILQSEIDRYWDVFGSDNGLTAVTDATITASYSNSTILDAIELSSSIALSDNPSKHIRFQLKDEYKFDMVNGMDYSISFTAVGKKIKPTKEAVMLVYVSGSAMKPSDKLYFDEGNSVYVPEFNKYGRRIGALSVKASDDETVNFGLVNQPFSNDLGGDGVLQFRVLSGIWNISDMSIAPAADTGFSPSFFQFSQQIPAELSHKRPDTFEFLAEFYDVNNNIADTVAYNAGVLFDGANMSISGKDNVLESNMFIGGDNTGSGMHLGGVTSTLPETGKDGATGSGFMRSVGYQGFISASAQSGSYGFMIYSGSVLPDSGDNYKGVGLELVGESGSLKFRTNPSVFEVLADAFFVGNKDLQFISGSTGNIEISSSDFHLTPEGNVTASAILLGDKGGGNYLQFVNDTLTVVGSLSVNNLFLPAIIDGETSTVLNASSSLDSNGFAKFVSASIGGFDVNSVAIKSADGSLILSGSGQITGSTVKLIGGDIGGWKLSESTIQGGNLILGKDGSIKSSDYVSDFSGFIITAEENGYAEFENCKIRGTMATTTFEKESVNAVGGQLFVANSAALSGSAVAAIEVSMSLKNVTGFAKGEVLLIKKVTDTGFNTEYVQVISSSRVNAGGDSDPDGLAGNIFVQRGNGFYTRSTKNYYGGEANELRWRSSNNNAVILTKYFSGVADDAYANGTDTGVHISGSHVSSASLHIFVTGSVGTVGDGQSLSLKVMNQSDSDAVLGTKPFWAVADGVGPFEKDLYFPTLNATGSKIKIGVVGTSDGSTYMTLNNFTASIDYGAIGSVAAGDSGSVGDPIGGPTNYTEGQVVVSTGRYISGTGNNTIGTGYIRLNANPKNKATPYMDIVERTGSGIYDIELKTRLGDLSGVAGTRNVPEGFQGFGLMTEVAFLSGSNIKLEAPTFLLGDKNQNFVSGSNGNIEISSSKFHIDSETEKFFVGQPNRTGSYIDFQGSAGTLAISASNFELTTDGQITASSMRAQNAVFGGIAKSDLFEFTSLSIGSSNMDDYLTEYTGADYYGDANGLNYSKLDLSGVSVDSRTYVRLGKRARYPIAHIVPPTTDGLVFIYLVFSAETGGSKQQNLIWSFGGAPGSKISSLNNTTYRATDGAGTTGGIFFQDETFDKFRGFAYRRTCGIANANGLSNSSTVSYPMAHHVMEDIIYTMLCQDGKWFLMDISSTRTGPTQTIGQSYDFRNGAASNFNYIKAGNLQRTGRLGSAASGEYSTSGSSTGTTFNLNFGGSLGDIADFGSDAGDNYFIQELGSVDTAKDVSGQQYGLSIASATANRYGLLNLQWTDRSGASAAIHYDLLNYLNVADSSNIRLTLIQAHDSDTTTLQLGDENDYDNLTINPQNGSITQKGIFTTQGTAQLNNGFDTKGTAGVVFNEDAQDANVRMESANNVAMFKLDAGSDFVAIGGAAQGDGLATFNVHHADANFVAEFINSTNSTVADGIMVNYTGNNALAGSAKFIQVRNSDNNVCFEVKGASSGTSAIDQTFTGGHDTVCVDDDDLIPGMIVESTGEVWFKATSSFDLALPFTQLSNSNGSKSVFGVINGDALEYDADNNVINADKGSHFVKNGYYMPPSFTSIAKYAATGSANRHLHTNSIGEGVMWVTNINGEITNGDYIESSVIKGYGRKQADDIMRSKTVAKSTEAIDWSEVTSSIQYSGSAYKKHLTAVTFHCG